MNLILEAEKFAEPYYKIETNTDNKQGKFLRTHVSLVKKFALEIGKHENADLLVLEIVAETHDVAKNIDKENHQELGSKIVAKFLEDKDLEEKRKKLIVECVAKHGLKCRGQKDKLEVVIIRTADAMAVLFDDEWQANRRKAKTKEKMIEKYDKLLAKVQIESEIPKAKTRIEYLKLLL